MNAAKMRAWLSIVELNDKQFEQRKEIESMKGKLAADKVFIELLNAKLDEKNAEIQELKIRAREADEAEKAAQPLLARVVSLTAQLTTAEYQIRIRDAQIEELKNANANPMFEDSDGLPMDVDEMACRLKVCEKRLDDKNAEIIRKNAEIIRLKAQLYDYEHPHDD